MAATAYLLILAWNDDMEAAKVPTVYSEAPLMTQEEPFTAPVPTEVGMNLLQPNADTYLLLLPLTLLLTVHVPIQRTDWSK